MLAALWQPWGLSDEFLIGEVGPHIITGASIRSINDLMTDEVSAQHVFILDYSYVSLSCIILDYRRIPDSTV